MGNVTSFAFASENRETLEQFQDVLKTLTHAQVSDSGIVTDCDTYYMVSQCDIKSDRGFYYLAGTSNFVNLSERTRDNLRINMLCNQYGIAGHAREETSLPVTLGSRVDNPILHSFASLQESVEEFEHYDAVQLDMQQVEAADKARSNEVKSAPAPQPTKSRDELTAGRNPMHHSTSSGVVVLHNVHVYDRDYGFQAWVQVKSNAGNKTHVNVPLQGSYVGIEPMTPGTSRECDLVIGLDDTLHGFGRKHSYNKTFTGRDLQKWFDLTVYPDWPPIPGGGDGDDAPPAPAGVSISSEPKPEQPVPVPIQPTMGFAPASEPEAGDDSEVEPGSGFDGSPWPDIIWEPGPESAPVPEFPEPPVITMPEPPEVTFPEPPSITWGAGDDIDIDIDIIPGVDDGPDIDFISNTGDWSKFDKYINDNVKFKEPKVVDAPIPEAKDEPPAESKDVPVSEPGGEPKGKSKDKPVPNIGTVPGPEVFDDIFAGLDDSEPEDDDFELGL